MVAIFISVFFQFVPSVQCIFIQPFETLCALERLHVYAMRLGDSIDSLLGESIARHAVDFSLPTGF